MNSKVDTIKQTLRQQHLFSELSDSQLDDVCQFSQLQFLSDNQMLFNQDDKVTSFYIVQSGKIKLFRISPDGQEKIIEIVKPGQTFAEALLFTHQTSYPVSSAALCETAVININANKFLAMLSDSNETCLLLLASMSFRLRQLVNEIDKLTLHSATCRIASYLVHEMSEGKNEFDLDIAKSIIAARLSVKPETFSRIIKNFKEHQVLSIKGNHITIHDSDRLKKMSIM